MVIGIANKTQCYVLVVAALQLYLDATPPALAPASTSACAVSTCTCGEECGHEPDGELGLVHHEPVPRRQRVPAAARRRVDAVQEALVVEHAALLRSVLRTARNQERSRE